MLPDRIDIRHPDGFVLFLAFLAAGLMAYAPCLGGDFIADDYLHIVNRPVAARGISCLTEPFFRAPGSGQAQYYRPLTLAVYGGVARLLGTNPVPFHLLNIFLHSFNSWLLAMIAAGIFGSRRAGAAAGLIFLLHPLQAEEVAYISGLGGLGATAFSLGAIRAWLSRPGRLLPLLLLGLGLLWKESPLVVPFLLSLTVLGGGPADRRRLFYLLPLWGVAAAYLGARELLLPHLSLARPETSPLLPRLGASAAGLATSLRLLAIPTGTHFYRSIPVGFTAASWAGLLAAGSLAATAAAGRWRAALASGIGFGIWWFLAAWLPFCGLRPLYLQRGAVFWGEHFSYFALAGAAIAIVGAGRKLAARGGWRRRAAGLTSAGVLLCFFLLARQQASIWQSELAVAQKSAQGEPELFRSRAFLAEALARRGHYLESAREYDCARRLLARHASGAAESAYGPFEAAHLRVYLAGAAISRGRAGDLPGAGLAAADLTILFPGDPTGPALLERVFRSGGLSLPPEKEGEGPDWALLRRECEKHQRSK